jgi:hypothetical protein
MIFRYILGTRGEYPADLDVVRNASTWNATHRREQTLSRNAVMTAAHDRLLLFCIIDNDNNYND